MAILLVTLLLQDDESLRARGFSAMTEVLESKRHDLAFEIKSRYVGAGRNHLRRLESGEETRWQEGTSIRRALDLVSGASDVPVVLDPALTDLAKTTTSACRARSARAALDLLCERHGLDYDQRYGVVFVSRVSRMWVRPEPPDEGDAQRIRDWIQRKDVDRLVRFGVRAIPLIEKEPTCEAALRSLALTRYGTTGLPLWNRWEEGAKPYPRLIQARRPLGFKNESMEDVVSFFSGGLNIPMTDTSGQAGLRITIPEQERLLSETLALVTIPFGLDVDLRGAVFVVVDPTRPCLPRANRWVVQELTGADERMALQLESQTVHVQLGGSVRSALKELGVAVRIEDGVGKERVTFRLSSVSVRDALASLTIPFGLDARIENETVVVFARK